MTLVVDVSTGRARLEAKNYYDINNESQMEIFILVYKMEISDIAPPANSSFEKSDLLEQDLWISQQFVRRELKYFSILLSLGISII